MPAPLSPIVSTTARVDLYLSLGGETVDVGTFCTRFEFRGMVNGGFRIKARLFDPNYKALNRVLIEAEYLRRGRSALFSCQFRLSWPAVPNTNPNQTDLQQAAVVYMQGGGKTEDAGHLEFTAIDLPSWYLNSGDASGGVFRGNVSGAIRACLDRYAPQIDAEVSDTRDSPHNAFPILRQTPKAFIMSLLDWSAALTKHGTNWLVGMDGTTLTIKEQADVESNNVAFYSGHHSPTGRKLDILGWEVLTDSSMAITANKLVTYGLAATSGRYLDPAMDAGEEIVFAKDATTAEKYKANVNGLRSFQKPPDGGPPASGWTALPPPPEIYSAGDLGLKYEEYIGGRARNLWMHLANTIMRVRFRVHGHGVFSNTLGLGRDTMTVEWWDADGQPFFLAGNWIVYGFHHLLENNRWLTDVYGARLDWDALAQAVPPGPT